MFFLPSVSQKTLSEPVLSSAIQLAAFEEEIEFFKSICFNAVLSSKAFGLLLFPKRCLIFEKNISRWSWENLYVNMYLYSVVENNSSAMLNIDFTAVANPKGKI